MTAPIARRRSRGARATLAALATLALAGCSVSNTITTRDAYEPSDGVRADLGSVRAGNLLVVAGQDGGPGVVVGYVTNTGGAQVQVSVAPDGAPDAGAVVPVPAGGTVLLGPGHEAVDIASVDGAPGGTTPLRLAVEQGRSAVVDVPVLDGTLAEYATLVPAPAD